MGLLDGKVAVITGAGSGIANAAVGVFVREGARVIAADFSGAQEAAAAEYGDAVHPVYCDVTDEAQVEAMIAAATEHFGRLDAVLNVAGIASGALLTDVTPEHYDATLNVNLRGVLLGMKHGIKAMKAAKTAGAIVNVASAGGMNAAPGTGVYAASKAGVIALTKTGALEVGYRGIRVNAICPGMIKTDIMGATVDQIPGVNEKMPLGRVGLPGEVAELAAFLASERASYITGAIIPVDGGWTAKLA
ncbi:MAG TPA: SDR family NAD(P)-dependent oxidoreductase [Mycobacteriales bacterium]|nr:SDR family NAD(P)-dependent oxidoreductase [Mycobacteriales bacterium]